jgi:NAD(P)-dependent dehydrogenase (short-subunit alcohol dehydrogenase family)
VTGASSGIGRATAECFLGDGWAVFASAREPDRLADLAARGARTLQLDVCDESSMRAAVASVEACGGAVDVLVNNAGYGQQGPLEETPLADIRHQFEVNLFGPMRLCQLVLPGMRRQGWGRIVNVGSMGGRITFPGGSAYHGSKYALEAVSDVLRFEVAGFGIDVCLIEPGPVASDFGAAALRSLEALDARGGDEAYAVFRAGLRRALEASFADPGAAASSPAEVAEVCLDAASAPRPHARYVVGTTARELIARRIEQGDEAWDAFVATLYPQPGKAMRGTGHGSS